MLFERLLHMLAWESRSRRVFALAAENLQYVVGFLEKWPDWPYVTPDLEAAKDQIRLLAAKQSLRSTTQAQGVHEDVQGAMNWRLSSG